MSLIAKLLISLAVAAGATVLTQLLADGPLQVYTLFAAFAAATVITTLLVTLPGGSTTTSAQAARPPAQAAAGQTARTPRPASTGDSARQTGRVKWFNGSKGFGFITKEDGEEIFVHFRSIRGEGRRGLRDGQRVSFVVAASEKGPQAEDVEGLE